jgi:ferredoxin-NADP reductase/ferredoxin
MGALHHAERRPAVSLRVRVLPGCTGMGSCARLAPAVFRIDPATGKAVVQPVDAAAHRAGVMAAAAACPFVEVEVDGLRLDEPIDEAVVAGIAPLAPGIIELRLRRPGFRFIPGQYVFLRLRDAEGDFFRSYSVVSAVDGEVVLCIRLLPRGRAGAVLGRMAPGERVGLSRAKGLFTLASPDRAKLFVTGGTGLAPVVPMCAAAPQARKRIIVGARRPADHFWLDRLRAMPNTEVVAVVEQAEAGWDGAVGKVLAPLAGAAPGDWPEIYASGSPGMVDAVRDALVAQGFTADAIRSDSFVPAGSAAAPAPAPPPPFDWRGLLRRAHGLAAAPLALVMLFYAITGFIANRSDLFVAEGAAPPGRRVPADLPLTHEALAPFIAGVLPASARLEGWSEGDPPIATFRDGELGWRARVGSDRTLAITRFGAIPPGTGASPVALAAAVGRFLSGRPAIAQAEVDGDAVSFDLESVWGSHHVEVDTAAGTWTASTSQPHVVVSLVDLHRGKHAGAWQRVIIDAAALVLALVTLSGIALSLVAAARRRLSLLLLAASAALLVLLVIAR